MDKEKKAFVVITRRLYGGLGTLIFHRKGARESIAGQPNKRVKKSTPAFA